MRNATEEINTSALAHDCSLLIDFSRHIQQCQVIYLVRVARICQCEKAQPFWEGQGPEAEEEEEKVQRGHRTWADVVSPESVRKQDRD